MGQTNIGERNMYPVTIFFIVVNCGVFISQLLLSKNGVNSIEEAFYFSVPAVKDGGEYYRVITSMFLHFDIPHLLCNMYSLYFIGSLTESLYGSIKFSVIYFMSGFGGIATTFIYDIMNQSYPMEAGASGCIFGVMGALFVWALTHKNQGYFDLKMLVVFIIIAFLPGFINSSISLTAHLGGFLTGCLVGVFCKGRSLENFR